MKDATFKKHELRSNKVTNGFYSLVALHVQSLMKNVFFFRSRSNSAGKYWKHVARSRRETPDVHSAAVAAGSRKSAPGLIDHAGASVQRKEQSNSGAGGDGAGRIDCFSVSPGVGRGRSVCGA